MTGNSGQTFSYCTGAPVVLGGVITKASEMPVAAFSEKFLFGPLGIEDYYWELKPDGNADTGGHMFMRPRDMAKFGLLFLNNGNWKGEQIVTSDWVSESVKPTDESPAGIVESEGYGYLWWTKNWVISGDLVPSYYADGNGGQFIVVFPTLNAVVVFTGGKYNDDSVAFGVLRGRILPAFR